MYKRQIQNRANTLATWCMFAQVVPMFQIKGRFSVLPVLYSNVEGFESLDAFSLTTMDLTSVVPNTKVQGFMAIIALVANVICLSVIIKRAIEQMCIRDSAELENRKKEALAAIDETNQQKEALREQCGVDADSQEMCIRDRF